MSTNCKKHPHHEHEHSPECGHTRIKHSDHTDDVHDGHLHHKHGNHWSECKIPVSDKTLTNATQSMLTATIQKTASMNKYHMVITRITSWTVAYNTNIALTSMTMDPLISSKTNT